MEPIGAAWELSDLQTTMLNHVSFDWERFMA